MISLQQLIEEFNPLFKGSLQLSEDGQAVWTNRENIIGVMKALKERNVCKMLIDITAVDYGGYFEVAYQVMALENANIIRLKVKIPGNDARIPSAVNVWSAADVLEREVYDLLGINFEGRNNLKRILCPDDFKGNPLKKDFKLDTVSRF